MTRSTKTRRSGECRGFTLVELLVVIAIIAIIAGLVVPSLMDAQGSAYEVQCMSNLKGLHQTGYAYSQGTTKRFPIARMKNPPAHESFNMLLNSRHGQSLEPETFVCPEGDVQAAQTTTTDGSREFLLDDYTNSYTWVSRPTSPTRKTPLSSDKYYGGYVDVDGTKRAGHKGALMVIDTTGAAVKLELTPDGEPMPGSKYTLTEDGIPPGLTR